MSKTTSAADCITAAARKHKLSDEEAQKILNDIAGTYVVAGLIADTLEFTIKRIEELYAKVGLGLKFDNKAKANRCKKLTEELRKSYFDMVYRQTADDNAERRASTQEALTEFTAWFTYMCYLLMQKSGLGEERNNARMQILTMLQNNFEDVEHLNMELLRKELLCKQNNIMHKFPYRWTLKDAKFTKDKGKVFSCFACGGGSTMGYKLAGFDVIGCNEIDPRMNKVYVANHHPKLNYLAPIQEFKLRKDLPAELYNLDILDGSPPCSSFSTAGNRDDDWGKEKKFREGQAMQVLDTLFFDFIDLAKELQPKIVIAENVKGLLLGEAKDYVRRIYKGFDEAGYKVCHTLCDASLMGVPQRRERVFFTAVRKDLMQYIPTTADLFEEHPSIDLDFNEKPIPFRDCYVPGVDDRPASQGKMKEYWEKRQPTDEAFCDTIKREWGKEKCFANKYLKADQVSNTLTSNSDVLYFYDEYRKPNRSEVCSISTFPQDYEFLNEPYYYICGMSVPPVMMAQVASRVYDQWLSKINLQQ